MAEHTTREVIPPGRQLLMTLLSLLAALLVATLVIAVVALVWWEHPLSHYAAYAAWGAGLILGEAIRR